MMKIRTVILLVITLLAGLVLFTGCELLGVTIENRIETLESDLNSNYSNVYKNWYSDTNTYQAGANPTVFTTMFPSSETYTISNISVSGSSATATLNSSVTHNDTTMSFQMEQDGFDWYISSLSLSGYSTTLNSIE